jgi:hypothetical protein
VRARLRAVRVGVVDEQAERLRHAAADVERARVLRLELAAGLEGLAGLRGALTEIMRAAVDQLAVDDLARLALDLQAHSKPKASHSQAIALAGSR